MKSIFEKSIDIILFFFSLLQLIFLLINTISITKSLNYIIHTNIYIIIFGIIASLAIKGIIKHYLAFCFFSCFILFLMGQKLFVDEWNVFLTFSRTELNEEEYSTFLSIMSLTEIFTYYSYCFFYFKTKVSNTPNNRKNNRNILLIVRMIFWITLPFAAYMQLQIVIEKSSMLYTDGYLVTVSVPVIVRIAYYIFTSNAIVYLAACPSRYEIFIILFTLLIFEGSIQLIQGRRALLAVTLLFIIWYLIKYNNITIMRLRYFLLGVVGILALIILFYAVELYRSAKTFHSLSIFAIVENFMISTGGSDSVLANTIQQADLFPKSRILYLCDSIINNPFTNILTGKMGIQQGYDYLESFNSFSHWISYLTEPSLYLSGHGMGSCYLAEVFLAFGSIGILIIAVILGKIISLLENISLTDHIFKNAIYFILLKALFTLPRDGLFSWFSDFIYLLFVFCIIFPFYNLRKNYPWNNLSNQMVIKKDSNI